MKIFPIYRITIFHLCDSLGSGVPGNYFFSFTWISPPPQKRGDAWFFTLITSKLVTTFQHLSRSNKTKAFPAKLFTKLSPHTCKINHWVPSHTQPSFIHSPTQVSPNPPAQPVPSFIHGAWAPPWWPHTYHCANVINAESGGGIRQTCSGFNTFHVEQIGQLASQHTSNK